MLNRFLITALSTSLLLGCGDDDPNPVTADTSAAEADDVAHATGADDVLDTSEPDAADDPDIADATPEMEVADVAAWPPAPATLGTEERPASYTLPDNYDAAKSWPVVLVLHGFGASGFIQDAYLGISAQGTERGFITLTPDGTLNPQGQRFWNATAACCDFWGSGVDDVSYLLGLLDQTAEFFNVDPTRVYLVGHSNGGFMSYRLACEAPERFAGLVSIAGSSFLKAEACQPAETVAVLQVHGTLDGTILYNGDDGYPGAETVVQRWAERNGCNSEVQTADSLDLDSAVEGAETTVLNWHGCNEGGAVSHWRLEGGGHIPGFLPAFANGALSWLFDGGPVAPSPPMENPPEDPESSCPAEMKPVDDAFCIDRWEAALEELTDAEWAPASPYLTVGERVVRAVAAKGLIPQGYISGTEAQAACQASGKRLCTSAEWVAACQGAAKTAFPYGNDHIAGACNDDYAGGHPVVDFFGTSDGIWDGVHMNDPGINQQPGTLSPAGAHADCATPSGVYDLHGNLHEWVSDANGTFRGGFYADASINGAGCTYVTTAHASGYHDYSTGFRCCSDM